MNPWAFVAIALGILIIIIGVKGTQHHVTSALTGKKGSQQSGGNNLFPTPNLGSKPVLASKPVLL